MKSAMADKQYRSYIYTEIRVSIKLRSTHPNHHDFDNFGGGGKVFIWTILALNQAKS